MPRRCGTRTRTRRTPAPISAISTRPITSNGVAARPVDQDEQDRLRRRQADRQRAQQHQFVHARGAIGQPEGDRAGDLHRRLVDAGARGRGRQRAGRRRLRRHHLPRRRAEGGDRDGGEARRDELRPQRQPGAAGAQGLHHRRRIQVGDDLQGLRRRSRGRQDAAELHSPAATRSTSCRTRRSAPARRRRRKKAALAAIEGLKAKKPIYVGPLKDNKTGKVVIDKTYGNLDPVPRQDGLSARRRRRLDDLRRERRRAPDVGRAYRNRRPPRDMIGSGRVARAARSDFAAAAARQFGICRHSAVRARDRGGAVRDLSARDRQVAGRLRLLCLARRLRHRLLVPEYAAALRAADPDRARASRFPRASASS